MLELDGVSKTYDHTHALNPTTLTIDQGKTTVLIGPSGCGKSTLLRLIVGLIRPDTGTVRIEGTEMAPDTAVELRRRMGYVIQDGGLFPHLTARGNTLLLAKYLKVGAEKRAGRLDELAELTRFPKDALDRYPVQLSGGQRQRVSLMRALMLDPDVLLLDEPLGALDPMIRADMQTELSEIFSKLGKTVVMVTHDLTEAAFFADTIVLMRGGSVVQQGTIDELTDAPADEFVTQFISAQRAAGHDPKQAHS